MTSIQKLLTRAAAAAALLAASLPAHAQFGIQAGQLQQGAFTQRYQPARIATGDFEKFRYGALGQGWFGNTDFTLGGVFNPGWYITEPTKERILAQINGPLQLSAGYSLDLAHVNVKTGGPIVLDFSLGTSLSTNLQIGNANTLGLVLKGNRPYAGQTVGDSIVSANLTQTRHLGIGAGIDHGTFAAGARLNIIQGVRGFNVNDAKYTLFTHADGTQVTLDADYSIYGTGTRGGFFQFDGTGFSLDLGAEFRPTEELSIDIALNNAGIIFWKGSNVADQVNVNWEGISIASLLQDSVPEVIAQQVDSLKQQIFPDTTDATWTTGTGPHIRLGARYKLSENGAIGLTFISSPGMTGPRTVFPLVALSYQHTIVTGLTLGANAYYGGYDGYGAGLMAAYALPAGPLRIQILAGSDNLLGLIAVNAGRGMNAYAGIGVDF